MRRTTRLRDDDVVEASNNEPDDRLAATVRVSFCVQITGERLSIG